MRACPRLAIYQIRVVQSPGSLTQVEESILPDEEAFPPWNFLLWPNQGQRNGSRNHYELRAHETKEYQSFRSSCKLVP